MGAGGPHDAAEIDQMNADDRHDADCAALAKHGITEDEWYEFSDSYDATWLIVNDMCLGHFSVWKARGEHG